MTNYKNKFFTLALLAGFVLATGTGCAGLEDMAKDAMKKFAKKDADEIDRLFKELAKACPIVPNTANPALDESGNYTDEEKKRVIASAISSTDGILGPEANYSELKGNADWQGHYQKLGTIQSEDDLGKIAKKLHTVLTQLRDCEEANEQVAKEIQAQLTDLLKDIKALNDDSAVAAGQ